MIDQLLTLVGIAITTGGVIYTARAGVNVQLAEAKKLEDMREEEREQIREHDEAKDAKDDRQNTIDNLRKDNDRLLAILKRHEDGCDSIGMTFAEMVIFIRNHPAAILPRKSPESEQP